MLDRVIEDVHSASTKEDDPMSDQLPLLAFTLGQDLDALVREQEMRQFQHQQHCLCIDARGVPADTVRQWLAAAQRRLEHNWGRDTQYYPVLLIVIHDAPEDNDPECRWTFIVTTDTANPATEIVRGWYKDLQHDIAREEQKRADGLSSIADPTFIPVHASMPHDEREEYFRVIDEAEKGMVS
jgi:hypothetical protein